MDGPMVAVRHIPCLCESCYEQLFIEWSTDIQDPKNQELFALPLIHI